jgi:hypothetical protein
LAVEPLGTQVPDVQSSLESQVAPEGSLHSGPESPVQQLFGEPFPATLSTRQTLFEQVPPAQLQPMPQSVSPVQGRLVLSGSLPDLTMPVPEPAGPVFAQKEVPSAARPWYLPTHVWPTMVLHVLWLREQIIPLQQSESALHEPEASVQVVVVPLDEEPPLLPPLEELADPQVEPMQHGLPGVMQFMPQATLPLGQSWLGTFELGAQQNLAGPELLVQLPGLQLPVAQ